MPGKVRKLFFSTLPKTLSPRFNSALVHREAELSASLGVCLTCPCSLPSRALGSSGQSSGLCILQSAPTTTMPHTCGSTWSPGGRVLPQTPCILREHPLSQSTACPSSGPCEPVQLCLRLAFLASSPIISGVSIWVVNLLTSSVLMGP